MCAIVDANVAGEVFGTDRPEAGAEFFRWLDTGRGRLIAAGKLVEELDKTPAGAWIRQAMLAGRLRKINDAEVDAKAMELRDSCSSDDPHVIALAQMSGVRLLYSNDRALHQDFRSKSLIDAPRGRVYPTLEDPTFRDRHRRLLANRNLCRSM